MPDSKKTTSKKVVKKATSRRVTRKAPAITSEERKRMVSEAAYYLAEQRGFKGGRHLNDWLEAEAEIESIYGKAK